VRIAVDARELAGRPTGVGRYLAELLRAWAASEDARRHEWVLIAPRTPAEAVLLPHRFVTLPGAGGTQWEQWTLMRQLARGRADVLFAPGYSAPLTAPCPIALTIHDVSFAAHPEWFGRREGRRRRTLAAWSGRRARIVLTDSAFSRDEIVRHLGLPADRVRVIPLGMRAASPAVPPSVREPLIVYVGSIFQRRHVDRLIDAFVAYVAPRVPEARLEIIGEDRTFPPQDFAAALQTAPRDIADRVAIRSYVDDATLAAVYARASVCAFLSEYEGFGLTPLEALAAGVAPAVLDTPVAREVYGPAARRLPDLRRETIGATLVALLTDAAARGDVLRHAPEVLARYDWNRTAAATVRAIEEAAGV
jgi:glycosyltransferase involved in cell wall biosynthesis